MRIGKPATLLLAMTCLAASAQPKDITAAAGNATVITGTVTHLSDTPLSGVLVRVYEEQRDTQINAVLETDGSATSPCDAATTGRVELHRAMSDTSGTFQLRTAHRGKAVLVACSDLYAEPTTASVSLDPGSTSIVTLRFAHANDFSAYVTEAGNPVSSAGVRIFYFEGARLRQKGMHTGPNGRARFENLPVAALEKIEVRSPDHAGFVSTEKIPLPAEDYPVWLERRGSIEVNVKDTNPANEKKAVMVSLLRAAHRGLNGKADTSREPSGQDYTPVQHREAVDGSALFLKVEPGWYKAIARHSAVWGESEPVHAIAGVEVTRVSVMLEQNAFVHGRVVDRKSRDGIAGAAITLAPVGSVPSQMSPLAANSDSDGNFSIEAVPGGTLKLRADHANYSPHSEILSVRGGRKKSVTVLMSSEQPSLYGRVVSDGTPLADALVILYKAGEAEVPVATAVSDSAGRYNLGTQDAGEYVALIEAPVGSGDEISGKSYSVTLEDKPVRLDMTFKRPVHVKGRVMWGEKQRPAGSAEKSLLFMGISGGSVSRVVGLNPDDRFDTYLEPGHYSVGLEDSPGIEIEILDTDDGGEILLEL